MSQAIVSNFDAGIKKIKDNPQLIFTVVVAFIIVGSFVFIANKFIAIANDAQERLINVRVGSIEDAFVSFANDYIDYPEYLNQKIAEIIKSNETIKSFRVLRKNSLENGSYTVLASADSKEMGQIIRGDDFLYTISSGDPSHSVTYEIGQSGERLFNTARAIVDEKQNVLGVVVAVETLSAADKVIQKNIQNSIYLLAVIIALILFLFLRHSKIVDYMNLYKKLKEVDQLKDDFISMASHELRTPLSIIRGYAEYIREAPDLSSETKDYASKIDISVKGLDSLVSDILDVSRIQQGRMTYELVKINPASIISEIVDSLTMNAKEKGLSVSFDKNKVADNHIINVDEGKLRQVLVNLIGNAVKYTQKGSVNVIQYEEGGQLYIRVSDTGIGLSAEEREKLFQKFYRVKSKETENIRGTGLGLWITAQIIKDMKGHISVESIKNVGSHFIISFPILKV